MKFALAAASIFALGLTLVSGSTISMRGGYKDHKDSCDGGEVLQNTTIATYNSYPIGFVAATCPLYCKDKKYAKRGGNYYCAKEECYLTCVDVYDYPIYPDDCKPILEYLYSLDSETFTVPAETYYEWYYGTCAIAFWNYDCYDYEVCYASFEYDAEVAVGTCLESSYGAVCEGSGNYDENYAIIVV